MTAEILRYAAFTVDGKVGIRPVWSWMPVASMPPDASHSAEVGYSETAFLVARRSRPNVYDVRYFSPAAGSAVLWACDDRLSGCAGRAVSGRRADLSYASRLRQHHDSAE